MSERNTVFRSFVIVYNIIAVFGHNILPFVVHIGGLLALGNILILWKYVCDVCGARSVLTSYIQVFINHVSKNKAIILYSPSPIRSLILILCILNYTTLPLL